MAVPHYLLDTCAVIWTSEGAPISSGAVEAFDESFEARQALLVSPISAWERGMLVSLGRITSPVSPKTWFDRLLTQPEIELAPMSIDILTDASFLPAAPPRDPADRIVIATARALDLVIVTRDRLILDYAAKGHVRALAC